MAIREEQLVCREMLEWAQRQSHSVKIRCDIIAINLNLLASEPDNMTLRRVTLKHVASLAEALCVTDLDQLQRRRAPRTNFGNWTVRIEVDGREPVFAYVWDVSPTGACLLVAEDVDLPAVFTIHFDNIPRQAQVVWRRWSFLGARFTDQLGAQIREQYELTLKRAADRHGGLPSYARARIP